MFGYIRPHIPELKMREYELYRAIYCGLCREMGRTTGQLSRLTLSFDFVLLCLIRAMATDESFTSSTGTCIAHPVKKRQYVDGCDPLRYCAAVSAYLTEGKLKDDVSDEKGFRRAAACCVSPAVSGMIRRADKRLPDITALKAAIAEKLGILSALEAEGCPSIDTCAEAFGALTAEVFSYGLPERSSRICAEIGRGIGRFIYVCDACDDLADDFKCKRFNPIISLMGSEAADDRHGKVKLSEAVADSIRVAANIDLERCAAAAELLCDESPSDAASIIRNVIYFGMPEMLKKVTIRACRSDADK